MQKILSFLAAMLFCCCSADSEMKAQNMEQKMYITIGEQTQSVTLVDNDATRELIAALQDASITVTLNDNDFEIWGSLGRSLTTKNEQMTVQPGDIVLYNRLAKTTSVLHFRLLQVRQPSRALIAIRKKMEHIIHWMV